ncbi:MAG: glycosyltransferase family 4 protein [Candidatus Methanomethylicaceae archaeon]
MNLLKNKRLALFFTFGLSLKDWHDRGIINREVALYNELSKYFDKIYFFTYGNHNDFKFHQYLKDNITIVPITSFYSKISKIPPSIKLMYSLFLPIIHCRILRNVNILKTNQMMGAWAAIIAKLFYRKKLIIRQGFQLSLFLRKQNTNLMVRFFVWLLELFSYHFANKIIVTSLNSKKYITHRYRINQNKIIVIPNYVDTNSFKPFNKVNKDYKRIIFVGRLAPEKNVFSLIDAVKGLDVKLIIIGDGPLREKLMEKVKMEKINNVEFLGIIPNEKLPFELNKSVLFILPSLHEDNPKALLEAMACGLPVIGTAIEGIKELIKHKENGYLCGTDINSISNAIIALMQDEKLRKKLSSNARRFIEENFSLKKIVEMELKIYSNLLCE